MLLLLLELLVVPFLFHLQVQKPLILAVCLPLLLPHAVLVLLHRAVVRQHFVQLASVLFLHFTHLDRKPLKSLLLNVLLTDSRHHLLVLHLEVFGSW